MMYRFLYDGTELWTPGYKDIFSPQVEIELNTAGRFSFVMAPDHPNYHLIQPLIGTVEVYENSELIWFGRAISLERDIQNRKSCYCEGALAYFNDSVQRPRDEANVTGAALLASILEQHNGQVAPDRQFTAGTIDIPDRKFGWENDYTDSMSAVSQLLQKAGGWLIPRRRSGVNFLDWYYELPKSDWQGVVYGENMLSFRREWSFAEKYTSILPVGDVPEGGDEAVTIARVNRGSDILDGPEAERFGRIVRVVKFPDVTTPAELLAVAREHLAKNSAEFDPICVDISAAELSYVDARYAPFRVGYQYHVYSEKHELDMWLPITRLQIPLDKGSRSITLGSARNPGAAELYLESGRQTDLVKQSIAPYVGEGMWMTPASGGKWVGTQEQYDALTEDGKVKYGRVYYIVPGVPEEETET